MRTINSVNLIGNLTKDPELRHTPGGKAICQLRIAVRAAGGQSDGGEPQAGFFDVDVWEAQGEACAQYLSKGSRCGVSGSLRFQEWEDRDTGAKRSKVTITAYRVDFLNSKDDRTDDRDNEFVPMSSKSASAAEADGSDDIPFRYLDTYDATGDRQREV